MLKQDTKSESKISPKSRQEPNGFECKIPSPTASQVRNPAEFKASSPRPSVQRLKACEVPLQAYYLGNRNLFACFSQ